MNPVLAFPVFVGPQEPVRHAMDTAAMDWFVIATLCCFFFLLGCFATMGWVIWRRTTRPEPHVKLLMELADSGEDNLLHTPPAEERDKHQSSLPPWERSADWWKTAPPRSRQ